MGRGGVSVAEKVLDDLGGLDENCDIVVDVAEGNARGLVPKGPRDRIHEL